MHYKSLLIKILPSLIIAQAVCSPALADSFCGFNQGLIGTKAIGSISPIALEKHRYETGICELNVFDAPLDSDKPIINTCTDFKHLPSPYIDDYEEKGFDPLTSDYFYLQVFDADDIWVQIALKSGEKKWAKQNHLTPSSYPYHHISDDAPVYIGRNIPTQTGLYDEPRLDKPAQYRGQQLGYVTDGWIDYTIPLGFFSHDIFKLLETYGVFDPSHIEEGKLATHYGEFLHAAYDVKAIIKDKQGREWLKAEEYLDIAVFDFWHFVEKKLEIQDKTLSSEDRELIDSASYDEEFHSKAGRTVYFPYREPSGTITMVMTDGPDCD